jgi:hypothetical protein
VVVVVVGVGGLGVWWIGIFWDVDTFNGTRVRAVRRKTCLCGEFILI